MIHITPNPRCRWLIIAALVAMFIGGHVYAMETGRVSVSSGGVEGNLGSGSLSISADGRFVAFESDARNLVPGDINGSTDIFVHDRVTRETTRVSVSSAGVEGNSESGIPSISADGRFVAFHSYANNLVPRDTGWADIFVRDRVTHETTRVSVSSAGVAGNVGSSGYVSFSADGRFVAFESDATNLVPGDMNDETDIFVHDRVTRETTRVSVSSAGERVTWRAAGTCPSALTDDSWPSSLTQATWCRGI